ncbi:hypothetical protein V865_003345 [Kwoniella europaea PYCC6329]|uniref:Dehydrin n=1 Tax=Kwoniella europaea PYCC6329 TaxID=1423913 RepID=A0AAX4KHS9_9TREE
MASSHNQGQVHGHGQYDETAAKPSIGQKIGGGLEELVGKATHNPGKVAEGEAKKHGYAGPPGGAQGYNETLHKGENPGGLAGEHSINPSAHGNHGQHEPSRHEGFNSNSQSHSGPGAHHQGGVGNQSPFPPGKGEPGFGGHPQQQQQQFQQGQHSGLGGGGFEGQHSGLGGGSTSRTHEGLGGGPAGHNSGLPLGSNADGPGHHGHGVGGVERGSGIGGQSGTGQGIGGGHHTGTGVGQDNVQPPFGGSDRRY